MHAHGFTRTSILLLFLILSSTLAYPQTDSLLNSDLPIVIIDTFGQEIPDDPKITAFMGIIDNGPGMRNALTDSANIYRGYIGIEIRGFSSQQFPKLQYGLELRDSTGADVSVGLLGMSSDADWVLSASTWAIARAWFTWTRPQVDPKAASTSIDAIAVPSTTSARFRRVNMRSWYTRLGGRAVIGSSAR